MEDSDHGCRQSLVQSFDTFILLYKAHGLENVVGVLFFVIDFSDWAENLCLHSSANEPKRVRYNVADDSCYTCRDWVELEWIVLPSELTFAGELYLFVEREINGVKEWSAKQRNWIPPKQSLHTLSLYDRNYTSDPMFAYALAPL